MFQRVQGASKVPWGVLGMFQGGFRGITWDFRDVPGGYQENSWRRGFRDVLESFRVDPRSFKNCPECSIRFQERCRVCKGVSGAPQEVSEVSGVSQRVSGSPRSVSGWFHGYFIEFHDIPGCSSGFQEYSRGF